ncbi:glycosyltransferase family 2 protein [Methylobacterium sp. 77]|uniref:glycosyltransferase family 2 protein n=1 Tax=Methylobacterium sp. 77 TaxID=1101192 RepID=UPI00039E070F|nr:glycosyltransferase family 2 protein [Methylobacterium sp. 77]
MLKGDDPILSIIINCYNYEDYVQSAIESVTSQKAERYELIVVDDGSTDQSWETIERLHVRSFRKENGGQVSACLHGVARTSAPFILFLDADDELLPNSISKIISLLDENVAKLQFPLLTIDATGAVVGPALPALSAGRHREAFVKKVERAGAYISPPTSGNVFRRDLCDLLHEAHYDSAVDGVMLLAAPFFGDIVSIGEPLGRYRVHFRNKSYRNQLPPVPHLRKHQKRFRRRVEHLKRSMIERGVAEQIKRPDEMYLHTRYDNYCDILEGRRIRFPNLVSALRSFPEWYTLYRRLLVAVFLSAGLVLPGSLVLPVLRIRLTGSWRTWLRRH